MNATPTAPHDQIAARLRAARAGKNLTLKEAGELAGLHYVSISRYEQCHQSPTVDAIYRLAAAYGVQPADLLPPLG